VVKHTFSGWRKKRGLYQLLTDQVEVLVRINDSILSLDMRAPLSFFLNQHYIDTKFNLSRSF